MVFYNAATKELNVKIVYYGPGLSGKTTNLQQVYNTLPEKDKGRMLSLATSDDRTLFFDFLPMELGEIQGMKTRVQLYTVPGQVYYNTTRKLVLRGCDGVVFVADSQTELKKANVESKNNLRENLLEQGDDLDQMPLVIQYNKRDLGTIMPVDEMRKDINKEGRPGFEAIATEGKGVFETLKEAIKITLKQVSKEQGIRVSMDVDKGEVKKYAAAAPQAGAAAKPAPTGDKAFDTSTTPPAATEKQGKQTPDKITGKSIEEIKMGIDKRTGDPSLAAELYKSELADQLSDEQRELDKSTSRPFASTTQESSAAEKSKTAEDRGIIDAAESLLNMQGTDVSRIADEIIVKLSNNEVTIDQNGIKVPVKILLPKSMRNINVRFDMQIKIKEDEDKTG